VAAGALRACAFLPVPVERPPVAWAPRLGAPDRLPRARDRRRWGERCSAASSRRASSARCFACAFDAASRRASSASIFATGVSPSDSAAPVDAGAASAPALGAEELPHALSEASATTQISAPVVLRNLRAARAGACARACAGAGFIATV
jgi:hypothetical protein